MLAFTMNTCYGCAGSFGCFYKNQSKTKFIFGDVGLCPQICSERQIITHYALCQCKYVLAQVSLREPFYASSRNLKV